MYHFQGESLPDRFQFHEDAPRTAPAACDLGSSSEDEDLRTVKAQEKEDDERAIAQLANEAVVSDTPLRHAWVGPGTAIPAVRRYLGVMKPVLMFRLLQRWVADHSLGAPPGFTTFRRALKESRQFLSFRKSSGQHSTCDTCKYHKDKLKARNLSISERSDLVESYCQHLLEVWRDRQSDASFVALSVQTALGGRPFQYNGILMIRSDGLDQAKHKTPRVLRPTKMLEKLPRPVLPVMMHWCHGHIFNFAIQDMDIRKSTATNLEGMCRVLSAVYNRFQDLPRTIHILLDNTPSQNKNSLMMRFWVKALLLGICRSVHLRFPVKGHTHNAIDALGGAAVTACSNLEFQTPEELVEIYKRFLQRVRFESSVWFRDAYKSDEQAPWDEWGFELPLDFGLLTGPRAPHLFHILFRSDLSRDDLAAEHVTSYPGAPPPNAQDIVLAVHNHMSDLRPFQVALLMPGQHLAFWRSRVQRPLSAQHFVVLFPLMFSVCFVCLVFFGKSWVWIPARHRDFSLNLSSYH